MSKRNDRKPANSLEAGVDRVQNVLRDLELPLEAGKLTVAEMRIFKKFGWGKSKSDWFEHELIQLAELARLTVHIRKSKALLKREGDVIRNVQGNLTTNPRFTACDYLVKQQLALLRVLGLASSQNQAKRQIVSRALKEDVVRNTMGPKLSLMAVPAVKK